MDYHHVQSNFKFLRMLPVAVARSSFGETLCISGFVDDVTFSCHGANGLESSTALCLEEFAKWWYQLDVR